ncbi:MAG: DUF1549 domain-containing protein [Balneolales bacterium]
MMLDTLSELWLWQLLSRLHPLVVHFPIGVLLTAFLLELFTLGGKRSELRPGIQWLVYIGAGTSLVAAFAGWLLAYGANYSASTLDYHQWSGIATVICALLAAFMLHRAHSSGRESDLNYYRGILTFSVLLLTVAGHFGASLTHGDEYLTSVMPWNYEAPSRGAPNELLTELAEHREVGTLEEPHLDKLNVAVRRIFANSCYQCHASDSDADGDLELDSKEAIMAGGESGVIIIPNQPDDSELMRRIRLPQGHDEVMPQKGKSLSSAEVELISTWIELGAHWSDGDIGIFREAEMALNKPTVPNDNPDIEHPIDHFTDAYFKEQDIEWAEPVGDKVFMRRVYMDVIGLLPAPEEVEAFVADTSTDKRDRLIDSVLSRDHDYAQHWMSFWNDLLRNDYSGTGFITGGRKQITEWLYNSLQNNKSYEQMVRQLINPNEDSEGFIRGIQWRGDFNASQSTEMQAAQNISQSMLGLNMKCASCHNSFTSNLTLDQSYSFAAVFADSSLAIERCDIPTGDYAEPGFIYEELGDIDENLSKYERLVQLSDILADEKNGRLYRTIANRFWARLMGRGLVEPTDEMDNEPWNQDLLDWLAADLIDYETDLKHLLSTILHSRTYQLPSVEVSEDEAGEQNNFVFTGPMKKRLSAEQFADAVSQVAAPFYQSVAYDPYDSDEADAQWIWYNSQENERASFPEPGKYYFRHAFDLPGKDKIEEAQLLITVDESYRLFLNNKLMGQGQDWRMVERINVTDQLIAGDNLIAIEGEKTGSVPSPAGILFNLKISYTDGENLVVSSNDQWKVSNKQPETGWEFQDFDDSDWENTRVFKNSWGKLLDFNHGSADNHERLEVARASLVHNDPFLTALGRPAREIVSTSRETEPTLLQALNLTNGKILNEVLSRGADHWMAEYGHAPNELVTNIFLSAFSRIPTKSEAQIAGNMLTQNPNKETVQDLLWAIVMQPEFQFIY